MLSFLPKTPKDITEELRAKFKARRKSLNYTQDELSSRSGVSLGSLKRFESSGKISLESLLKLALVLECLEGFSGVCEEREEMPQSIEDLR
ncbi:helix-turn-helix transcriptional regulator [bacterium]|nr:helix-turn-helix transcriptional regulator [bacterium]MBU1959380.1 helix-turn-helix transcriptional regulator [bacterium]